MSLPWSAEGSHEDACRCLEELSRPLSVFELASLNEMT